MFPGVKFRIDAKDKNIANDLQLLQILINSNDFVSVSELEKELEAKLIFSRIEKFVEIGIVESRMLNGKYKSYKIVESKRETVKGFLKYIDRHIDRLCKGYIDNA